MKKKPVTSYRVLVGFNYGIPEQRHEPDEVITTLPAEVAADLLQHTPPVIAHADTSTLSPQSTVEGV